MYIIFDILEAVYKCWWMAKLIYTLKLVMLHDKITKKISKETNFGVNQEWLCMCRVGTQAAFPGDAAHNDLLLSKSMHNLNSDAISK